MEVFNTSINGLFIIEPTVFNDERGYFYESFNIEEFKNKTGIHFNPVQDNESKSVRGVIRGLHFQKAPYAQAKLVRVVKGEIIDVAVDLRPESETFGQYIAILLNETNKRQFFIPEGFAHGFVVLSDEAIFQYKCNEFYHPEAEGGISYKFVNWEDIAKNKIKKEEFILSEKDKNREIIGLEEIKKKYFMKIEINLEETRFKEYD